MIITIQKLDGETFTVECEPMDYVDDLRDIVEELHGVRPESQRYSCDGVPIDDTGTLKDNGIVSDCTLVMDPYTITVILPSKKKLRLILKPDDLVIKAKKAVSKKTGLPPDSLSMIFDGREIKDTQTIAECDLSHDDTIFVETFTIRVSHWDGDVFSFKDMNPRDTIESIKQKMFELCQLPLDEQRYMYDGRPIGEFLSLRDQQIPHKAILDLQQPIEAKKEKFNLSVFPLAAPNVMKTSIANLTIKHWDGMTKYSLEFDPKEYVDDIKEKLTEQYGIPLAHQRLSYKGADLDDTETLEDQGVDDGATLVMEPMKVSVLVPGQKKPFKIPVLPSDKVARIKRIVAKKCGIELAVQLLFFQGVEVKDKQTMASCKIEHGSELNIESFCLIVEHWNGAEYTINDIKPTDLIEDIKIVLEEVHGISMDQQKYEFKGKAISEFMALSDQQIRHKCRLQLLEPPKTVEKREKFKLQVFGTSDVSAADGPVVPTASRKTITISVQHGDGDAFEIDVDPQDYVEALKEKIHEVKHIPVEHQRLSHVGGILDDADTLAQRNIQHGAKLVLEPMKLVVLLPDGKKSIKIKVNPDDKIKKIKRVVAKKCKLEADKLCVMFYGKELEDMTTLVGCGVDHDDKIKVETFELSIAHWSGDVFVLDDIHPDDCIEEVQELILKRRKIPLGQQKFKFNGKPIPKLISLKAQKINHKSILIMEDPQPALFSPRSPRPTISHIKDVDTDDEFDYDDVSDTSSVASWLKEVALDENYTAELCKVDPSSESWLGMEAAKENKRLQQLHIPVL